jgi:membrane dipeptidase
MTHRRIWLVLALLALIVVPPACRGDGEAATDPLLEQARDLAQRIIVADTHLDVPYRLNKKMEDVGERTEGGDFDFPRAIEGGLDVAFMSIFVPPRLQEKGGGKALADRLIDLVEGIVEANTDKFILVGSVQEVTDLTGRGQVALSMGMENGAGIEDDLANLRHFHDRGIRYITLAHGEPNLICDSSCSDDRRWNGLSPYGREVVREMNRLGIMIDVSHITDDSFFDVIKHSRAPIIASHSACRAFTPGWERNMSDEMIERLAENGGVIQIAFGSSFVNAEYNREREKAWKAIRDHLETNQIARDSDEARAYRKSYFAAHPTEPADVAEVADHIDHVVQLVGIDHVGLGSDFDGLGDSAVTGLKSVADYPNLIRELIVRGYTEQEIEKICSGNLLRVWSEVERVAAEMQAEAN